MIESFKNLWIAGIFFFIIGIISISIFEQDISIFFLPYFILLISAVIFFVLKIRSKAALSGFFLYFSINLFWVGISVLFRNYFGDYSQNNTDAFFFYQMSTKSAVDNRLSELVLTSEGAFAIYTWVYVYKFFTLFGFTQTPTIGILFNSWLLSIGCVVSVKIVNFIYNDERISKKFIILYSFCAIYWLFGSVHVRDSFVVLLTIIQLYFTIYYLKYRTTFSYISLLLISILCTFIFPFLRTEFYFIPMLFVAGATFIPLFLRTKNKNTILLVSFLAVLISIGFVLFISGYADIIFEVLERGQKGYLDEVAETASSSSLGVKLIINQPLLLRLILGSVYLHLYPIPFWYGFKTDTIYDLFKSLNLFFLWGIIPLVYIGICNARRYEQVLKEITFFCIAIYLTLVLAIAGTSLETRHLSVFFVPLLIIAVKPDLKESLTKRQYKKILARLLSVIVFIHLAWIILKYAF